MSPQTRATPAEAYQDYYVPAIFAPLTEIVMEHAAPRAAERVLDVACGTGVASRAVAARVGPAGSVTGIDVNPAMVSVARTVPPLPGAAPTTYRQGDALDLEVATGSVDLALCQQGLQFFADRGQGTRELRRVLDRDGRAVLAVWRGLEHHLLFDALARAELPHLVEHGLPVTWGDLVAPFSLGDPGELRGLLLDAGFVRVDLTSASILARFPSPDRFVERLEHAYAAVVPRFAADPEAFAAYLEQVTAQTRQAVAAHRRGDHVVVPMHTTIAVARAGHDAP